MSCPDAATTIRSRGTINATLFGAVAIPLMMLIPAVLFGGTGSVDLMRLSSVLGLFCVCGLGGAILRAWDQRGLLRVITIVYPLVALLYWWNIGRTIQFGDDESLLPMAEHAASCWNDSPTSGVCFLQSSWDSRYIASSIYHGLRICLYGDSQLITVSWGCVILLSAAMIALPGLVLSGLTRNQVVGLFAGILMWPDFLDMTGWLGRDLLMLWAIIAWYSGIRYFVCLRGVVGVSLALIGVILLAFTRPVYLLICALDLAVLITLRVVNEGKQKHAVAIPSLVLLAVVALLSILVDGSLIEFIRDTSLAQASVASQGLGATTSSNIGGNLSALTGPGYAIAIPIRLVISTMAPFPWTSQQIFYDTLGGYNGNILALGSHVVKAFIGVTGLLVLPMVLVKAIRRIGIRSLIQNTNAPICIALLVSAGIADAGYSRYIAMSFPFLASAILHYGKTPNTNRWLRDSFNRAMAFVVFGTVVVLLIYETRI